MSEESDYLKFIEKIRDMVNDKGIKRKDIVRHIDDFINKSDEVVSCPCGAVIVRAGKGDHYQCGSCGGSWDFSGKKPVFWGR